MLPAGLLALLALGAWARLPGLVRTGLTSDEAVYVGQGAALTGDPAWSSVRAHPPLFGLLLSVWPGAATGDLAPRLVAVVLGLSGVVMAVLLGRELAGRTAGLVAGTVVALMPYHVDVTRLALVDVPMAATTAAALLLLVRGARTGRWRLVEGAGLALGVGVLFKETALLTVAAVALAVVVGDLGVPRRVVVRAAWVGLGVVSLFPGWLLLTGGTGRALEYVAWQVRRPGGATDVYLDLAAPRMGWGVLAAAAVGGALLLRRGVRGSLTVGLSVLVPTGFYLLWPVAGYPYLLAVVVPVAALAGVAVAAVTGLVHGWGRARVAAATAAVLLAVTGPATAGAQPPPVAGAAGVPAVREAARWVLAEEGSGAARPVVTAAPWVSNVLRHYAPGRVVTSIAPTDAREVNPAYHQVSAGIPSDALVVWDAWSATTDREATRTLLAEVRRRQGRVAHVESVADGSGRVLVVVFVLGP